MESKNTMKALKSNDQSNANSPDKKAIMEELLEDNN